MTKKLTDWDLPMIGHQIGVGEDEIHAILDVESRGSGFDAQGRVVILFEPHVFYKEIKDPAIRAKAVQAGLAYPKWGTLPYPRDSWPRYLEAYELDPVAAMRSCSWGLGQIMGFNHKAAGYDQVMDMVIAFEENEATQLQGMVNFIKSEGLDKALKKHDWEAFARGYNGKDYAVHNYHGRLKNAYAKWSKIKDTPWTPDMDRHGKLIYDVNHMIADIQKGETPVAPNDGIVPEPEPEPEPEPAKSKSEDKQCGS